MKVAFGKPKLLEDYGTFRFEDHIIIGKNFCCIILEKGVKSTPVKSCYAPSKFLLEFSQSFGSFHFQFFLIGESRNRFKEGSRKCLRKEVLFPYFTTETSLNLENQKKTFPKTDLLNISKTKQEPRCL